MNQAGLPLYIRFGEIPKDKQSRVHRGDAILRKEGGLSVWEAVCVNGRYYPIMPQEPNEHTICDFFDLLMDNIKKVYLVTGQELPIEGADREPLLIDVKVIREIEPFYRRPSES